MHTNLDLDQPWAAATVGRLDRLAIESTALRDNPLGDPFVRPLWIYLPPGYEEELDRRYPSIYLIQGLTGQVDMWANRPSHRPTVLERMDSLFADPQTPPCVLVYVDCWTSLGGSQFLDSPGTGRYLTYLCDEVVQFVDAHYRTIADRARRGIAGKSSGGYGAMVVPMLRPDVFGGLATHAGDALFECCYLPDFGKAVRALRAHYEGSYERFWEDFHSRPAFSREGDDVLLNCWCMAACYSTDADGTVHLPFDPATGRIIDDVWQRWLSVDPVRMVPAHTDVVRSLRGIYIDAGTRDEWFLDLGAEAFRKALADVGVTDVRFELFDAGHGGIEYRYPIAVRYLAERLSA
jgi:hypothetical protein